MELPKKQKQIYDFIASYKREKGVSPLMSEIAREMGVTRQTIALQINTLIKKGYVKKIEDITHRNLILIKKR